MNDGKSLADISWDELGELQAALAAERSRVNEAEHRAENLEHERHLARTQRDSALADAVKWKDSYLGAQEDIAVAGAALETRDAEVERLRTLIARAAWYDDKTKRDCGSCSRSVENCNTRVWEYGWNCLGFDCRAALATPEATTPAVPEPKEPTHGDAANNRGVGGQRGDQTPANAPLAARPALTMAPADVAVAAPAVPGRLAEAMGLVAELVEASTDAQGKPCVARESLEEPVCGACLGCRAAAFLAPQPEPSAPQTDSPTGGSVFPPEGLPGSTSVRAGLVDTSPSPVRREPGDLSPAAPDGRMAEALALLEREEADLLERATDARKRGCAADVIATLDGKWVQAGRSVSLLRAFLAAPAAVPTP